MVFVRKAWEECAAFITICLGVAVPLQAGVLEGKTATGPRSMLDLLRKQAPGTNWVEKRWVRDGKLWTSGALLNGPDLIHAFVREHWGVGEEALATSVSRMCGWPNRDVDYKDVPWKV
jgi:transcriptional regulator GlxA family with amidase domain